MNTLTDKLAAALRDALATLEALRPRGILANDASIADYYPNNTFGLRVIREALATYDALCAKWDAVNRARDVLSDALEDEGAGNDEVRSAAIDLCAALNAFDDGHDAQQGIGMRTMRGIPAELDAREAMGP